MRSLPKALYALIATLLVVGAFVFYQFTNSKNQADPTSQQTNDTEPAAPARAAQVPSAPGSSWTEIDDPTQDGWDTEVLAEKAKKQLSTLVSLIAGSVTPDHAEIDKLITPDFTSDPLLPDNLHTAFENDHIKVLRSTSDNNPTLKGTDRLISALQTAAKSFSNTKNVRYKVKVFKVHRSATDVTTRQFISISGHTTTGTIEQHATWDVSWQAGADDTKPQMRKLSVVDFEQTTSQLPQPTLFSDCTESALGKNPCYSEQFLRGMNHWFSRIQDRSPWEVFGNPGITVGDVNGDGLEDLFVCQEGSLPNRLFIQNPDGTATEQAASWGVDWLQSSRSALLVDLDNDSDQDLVVAIHGALVIAENVDSKHFRRREILPTADDTMSLSAVDYDLDGLLDIYICVYNKNREQGTNDGSGLAGAADDFVVHDANNGGPNTLFKNSISKDGWKFKDVTAALGLDTNNQRYSLAASWDDFDNDGDQDLYVANDFGRDSFYRNDLIKSADGKNTTRGFTDISEIAGAEDSASGMSVTWGDYNRDGWMDVFVSNMWSSAGNRITYQEKFQSEKTQSVKHRFQRLARGNTLLHNQGDGTFIDQSAPTGVEMGRWAWGTRLADLDNDGWQDVVIANGFITTEDTGDL